MFKICCAANDIQEEQMVMILFIKEIHLFEQNCLFFYPTCLFKLTFLFLIWCLEPDAVFLNSVLLTSLKKEFPALLWLKWCLLKFSIWFGYFFSFDYWPNSHLLCNCYVHWRFWRLIFISCSFLILTTKVSFFFMSFYSFPALCKFLLALFAKR